MKEEVEVSLNRMIDSQIFIFNHKARALIFPQGIKVRSLTYLEELNSVSITIIHKAIHGTNKNQLLSFINQKLRNEPISNFQQFFLFSKEDLQGLVQAYKDRSFDEEHRLFKNKFISISKVLDCLHVDPNKGLVGIDFQARDAVFGSNQKEKPKKQSYYNIFKKNMTDFGIKILILASVILVILRLSFEWENRNTVWIEGTSILAISIVVTIVQSLTEYRIGQTLVGLNMTEQSLIKDCILLDGQEIVIQNEGESQMVRKETYDQCQEHRKRLFATFFHHQKNSLPSMVLLKQTFIIHGTGKLLVISVTNQRQLFNTYQEHYSTYIQEWIRFLLDGITLLVAAVPEGINLALTLTLINSTQGMLKQNYLVKEMKTIETIGQCDIFLFREEQRSSFIKLAKTWSGFQKLIDRKYPIELQLSIRLKKQD
eukprot:403371406